jgi:DNA-binding CsgD family transcriptional regulator
MTDHIIAGIYQAAAGTRAWSHVLGDITGKLGLLGCQFVGFSMTDGAVLFSHANHDAPMDAELEYIRTYHELDPRLPLLHERAPGDWLYDEDVFDADIVVSNAYYRDLLLPYGGRHSASAKLFVQDGEAMLIGFMSHLADVGFTLERRAFLQVIAFHLCQAAAIYQKTRRMTTAAFVGTELLHRMPRPALLLETDRVLASMNEKATDYLAHNKVLLLVRDRVAALDKATDADLATAFHAIAKDIGAGGEVQRRIIRLPSRNGSAGAALSLTAFVPNQSMYAFGTRTKILMVVHARSAQAAPDMRLWEAAYNLTPSQSRVALEMFLGRDIREAAESLGIGQTTVKSHLKDLYRKTDTSRQSQLILALAGLQAG